MKKRSLHPEAKGNWAWREGAVSTKQEHIQISYGEIGPPGTRTQLVAMVTPPVGNQFTVQFVLSPENPRYLEILNETKAEIDFYLVDKGEETPWRYAIYHCSTAANLYSLVHWSYYPFGGNPKKVLEKNMDHSECVKKLKEMGKALGFHAVRRSAGKKYELGNPDCVWYYIGKGQEVLRKIAKGEKAKYLPIIAFEVAFSEKEKNLRGSLVTLQLTNASANIIVLLGSSEEYKSYLKKLLGRYSYGRFRIWTSKDVQELHARVIKK